MIENVKIPIDHHTILVFWLFQNLLILSHLSESFDVPAGCYSKTETLNLILNSESVMKNIYNREVENEMEKKSYTKQG